MMNGICALHEEGITHRNIHPDSFILELPNVKKGVSKIKTLSRAATTNTVMMTSPLKDRTKVNKVMVEKVNVKVSEYWFLHNPRKAHCVTSHGRADWGNKNTTPPEALSTATIGMSVCDRSDIYGFGVCVYHWATAGRSWPPEDLWSRGNTALDTLRSTLPTKWGKWLHSLLNMCLQRYPSQRASAKDIHMFLSSRHAKS